MKQAKSLHSVNWPNLAKAYQTLADKAQDPDAKALYQDNADLAVGMANRDNSETTPDNNPPT